MEKPVKQPPTWAKDKKAARKVKRFIAKQAKA